MKLGIKDGLKHIFYIELEISGDGINTFFNMCRKKDIIFFDVQYIKAGNNAVRARIARNDFFMIKNLVKAFTSFSFFPFFHTHIRYNIKRKPKPLLCQNLLFSDTANLQLSLF